MDFHEILSSGLPAPRDDEPESLRNDILDELDDHLACAYRREVMRGADAQTARERVIDRFGDPATLACRLWFDAMKGRIMKQRILMIYSIVLTLLFVGLVGMLFMQSVAARRLAAEALARAEEERHRAEAAQQQMLQKLEAISKAAQSPKTPGWIPVTFKLRQETIDGPPAVGYHASLGKGDRGADKEGAIHRESDDKGLIDFGVVPPGDWEYVLSGYTEGGGTWRATGKLNVLPGTTIDKTICCPSNEPQLVPVSVDVDWPRDLADRGLAILATLQHTGFTYEPPLYWNLQDQPFSLLCGASTNRVQGVEQRQFYLWKWFREMPSEKRATPLESIKLDQLYVDLPGVDLARKPEEVRALPGNYRLRNLLAVRPLKEPAPGFHGKRCEFVAYAAPRFSELQIWAFASPPTDQAFVTQFGGAASGGVVTPVPGLDSYWHKPPALEARKDQPNHWTIHLPDELIKAMREKLRDERKQ